MKLNKIMLAIAALTVSGGAFAHGFVKEPPSRDYLCHANGGKLNTDCGNVEYEPQSNGETADRAPGEDPNKFPMIGGPKDGELGNGGFYGGSALNIQTADRWAKNSMQSGPQNFTWHFTAKHRIKNFQYYITKEGWNPNQPLTRDSLELVPFCTIEGNMSLPPEGMNEVTHSCDVPERSGYHVIYGTWDVGDTSSTFYKAIDVEFEDKYAGAWTEEIGTIRPSGDLHPGSVVKTRVFDAKGERPDLSTSIEINSTNEGLKDNWAQALASKINQQDGNLRAGLRKNDDSFIAVQGSNTLYTKADSGLVRVEIDVKAAEEGAIGDISISGVQDQYTITDSGVTLDFAVGVTGKLALEGKIFNANDELKGEFDGALENGSQNFSMALKDVKSGKYTLAVIGTNDKGQSVQKSVNFSLKNEAGDYDFVYPEGVKGYKGNTLVLQEKDGNVYQCKAGPTAGWCQIYSGSANHYEPGVGSNWQDAWELK